MPLLRRAPRGRRAHLPPGQRVPALTGQAPGTADVLAVLAEGEITLVGRLADASNHAFLAEVTAAEQSLLAIYKPVAGERPLWDFPDGTLAGRETAAFLVSEAGGWDVVPETVLRSGPRGPGSLQRWVGDPGEPQDYVVDVVAPDAIPPGWLPVLSGEGEDGGPVVVVHEDSAAVAAVAAFDAVINNSDRKGSHLVREGEAVRGFDHGVSLHCDDKLRTVLWGFAGRSLPEDELVRLHRLDEALAAGSRLPAALGAHLTEAELAALQRRVRRLLELPAYPLPGHGWPAIPWPPL
ncbi:SCO1664 family protein [Knoellia sp. 3-2P3]|uniref:SCO1664 family protein n=1 Tax=unclassified Knoellia TaxID=2618719 RepID=UPI0023DBCAD0|nr:SCO1664 family protein [Knoellia sp. 3-2P3]MDF2091989.1 SCO1664 family protein [Knoellia sp. 3-2P3]